MGAVAAPARAVRARGVTPAWAGAATAFLLLALAIGLVAGPVDIGLGDVLRSLAHRLGLASETPLGAAEESILWEIRAPRVVLAALVGGMLALAGATYQGVFHNPLADPYLLGVAAGAGLGATLAIAYLPGALGGRQVLPLAAFLGGSAAVALAYGIGRTAGGRGRDTATFVLAGVTVASFFTAVQTFVQQQNTETLQEVTAWILGGMPSSGWADVGLLAPYVVIASAVILAHRRVVDVLSLGDAEATSLGVDVRRVRLTLVIAATVGTAAAVSVSGLIAFVGIIVPHAIRLLAGTSYRALLPLSLVVGAGFLVLCDVVARTALAPAEIPIGVVTAFFGAPFFALVLRTRGARS
ncbi:MAG: FecCD family ABC transporter permease [Gaiella sp.]